MYYLYLKPSLIEVLDTSSDMILKYEKEIKILNISQRS